MNVSRLGRRHGACAAFAAAAFLIAAPASADDIVVSAGQSGNVTRTLTVSADGLDLSSAAGQRLLDRRVKLAAQRVCDYSSMHGLRQPSAYTTCAQTALSDARDQVTRLAATHANERLGR